MRDVYIFLDETGQLGMAGDRYYGLGQATFMDDLGSLSWEGTRLRFELERQGVNLPKGFHAKMDSESTREKVVTLIAKHKPRIDVTLLNKSFLPPEHVAAIESDETVLYYLVS